MFRNKRFCIFPINLIVFSFVFQTCIYDFYRKEFVSEKQKNDEVLLLALLGILPNPNQKLFGFIPGTSRNLSNSQFLNAEWFPKSNKKKLVFVHGWNPAERDSDPITNDEKKFKILKIHSPMDLYISKKEGILQTLNLIYTFIPIEHRIAFS